MRRLIGFTFRAVSYLVASLPRVVRDGMGHFIGFLWFDVLRIRRRIAIENVSIAFPNRPMKDRVRIARASLHHMGRTIVEYTLFPFTKRKDVEAQAIFEGLENIDQALKEGRGVLLMTCHLGNGDYAISALSLLGYPINLISKEFKSRWLNELWFGMRRKHGTRFIKAEKSSFEILKALRRNEIVFFVLDQFMGPPVGVRTTFFGKETGTAAGCALIASRTDAPVIPCYTYRRNDGRHVLVFEPPIPFERLDNSLRQKNITVMTQIYTDKIQTIVQQYPEQWMWIHRRWKEFRD